MLSFLQSRFGVGIVSALIVVFITFVTTVRFCNSKTEIMRLQAQLAVLNEDLRITRSAEITAKAAAVALEQKSAENKEYLDELERELSVRPGRDACRLDDSDASRLLEIQ
jgi:hypothetical protein